MERDAQKAMPLKLTVRYVPEKDSSMQTRRITFWVGIVLLSSGGILCIGLARYIGSKQFQRLRELTAFIKQSQPELEGMEVAGQPLSLFLKEIYLNNLVSLNLATLAVGLLILLVILLAATLVIVKRKKRDTIQLGSDQTK